MKYTLSSYRRLVGKVYTTSDGHKFINSKISPKYIYLKCAIFRTDCKGTGRLNRVTDLITPLPPDNHNTEEYRSDVFDLKTKCKKTAMHSQTNLRHVFDDTTRGDPSAREVSFPEWESAMYRARRRLQPKFPSDAVEFCEMLPTASLGKYYQGSVTCGTDTAVIFYSDAMSSVLCEVMHIQFDGTFFTVPIQFTQLWTIFVAIGRHSLPAIHCLMTAKSEELYTAVLERISSKYLTLNQWLQCRIGSLHQGMLSKKFILKFTFTDAGFISVNVSGERRKS